jgi:hypothetical protein
MGGIFGRGLGSPHRLPRSSHEDDTVKFSRWGGLDMFSDRWSGFEVNDDWPFDGTNGVGIKCGVGFAFVATSGLGWGLGLLFHGHWTAMAAWEGSYME